MASQERVIVVRGELTPSNEETVVNTLEAYGLDWDIFTPREFDAAVINRSVLSVLPTVPVVERFPFGPYLGKDHFQEFRNAHTPDTTPASVGLMFNRLVDNYHKRSRYRISSKDPETGQLIINRPLEPYEGIHVARREDVGLPPFDTDITFYTHPDSVLLDNHVIEAQSLRRVADIANRDPDMTVQATWRFLVQLATHIAPQPGQGGTH